MVLDWVRAGLLRGTMQQCKVRIDFEVMSPESDKAIYCFFAAAMAKAMYPNARFGTGRWDELCSKLPKSAVNPSLAKQIVKSWWKDYKETWQKCIYRLYDCEPAELEQALFTAPVSSPHDPPPSPAKAAVDSAAEIELESKLSEAMRGLAGRINRNLDTSDTQLHRLTQVLNEYFFYTRDFQLDLAEAAIIWAIASLASHERRAECESNLHALSDIMYVSTDDAGNTLNESEKTQIVVAATAVWEYLTAAVGDILRESAQKIGTREEVLQTTAESLHQIRVAFLEHSPPDLLRDLIAHCFIMCKASNVYELGMAGSETDVAEAIKNVFDSSSQVIRSVVDSVESGDLVVQDGVIVKPHRDADVE